MSEASVLAVAATKNQVAYDYELNEAKLQGNKANLHSSNAKLANERQEFSLWWFCHELKLREQKNVQA